MQSTHSPNIICQARTTRPEFYVLREEGREEFLEEFREPLRGEGSKSDDELLEFFVKLAQFRALPSWALDFREKTRKRVEFTSVVLPYNTCNPSTATFKSIDKTLCAKGFKTDEVDGLGPTCSHNLFWKNSSVVQPTHDESPYEESKHEECVMAHFSG